MASQNQLRDIELSQQLCFKVVVSATGAVVSRWTKVTTVGGEVLWYSQDANVTTPPTTVAPTVLAGESLIPCDSKDLEPQVLCEYTPAGVFVGNFLRVFEFDSNSQTYLPKDYLLDGITAYTVTVGNVVKVCGENGAAYTPYGGTSAANGGAVVIPPSVKSFSIVNLGVNGDGLTFEPTVLTGGAAYTIPANVVVHEQSVMEDQDGFNATAITVTPGANSMVFISWVAV